MKKRVVLICPGRGSYTKESLGYLKNRDLAVQDFIKALDKRRLELGEPTLSELDQMPAFNPKLHTKGENASALIFASAYCDFMSVDRDKYEIVAICGNSMGWYLALAFSGALQGLKGFEVVNTMGSMMKSEIIGGQIIYPIVNENWQLDRERVELVEKTLSLVNSREQHEAYISIHLGGYVVLAGNRPGTSALLKELPRVEDFPFQLINHAAFHTPLMNETSQRAFSMLSESLFSRPEIPLVDGRGVIWQTLSTNVSELYRYTLGHQVIAPYDFSLSVGVALKEFAPDHLMLLGPGASLGGALGQILVMNNWRGIGSKAEFKNLQERDPFLLTFA